MKHRIEKLISEYDAQGWHRTGTDVDAQSIEWMNDQVRKIGLEPSEVTYELDRVEVDSAYLEFGSERITGTPLFDCSYTDEDGVTGLLDLNNSVAEITLLDSENWGPELLELRKKKTQGVIVVITNGHETGLSLANAFDFLSPYGPPVLQIGDNRRDELLRLAENEVRVRVIIQAHRVKSSSATVLVEIDGREPDLEPIVINTPLSGWWSVAAERGGGLACWMEILRNCYAMGSDRRILFAANTGHELGFIGLENLLDQRTELATSATWVHFGANIGAKLGSTGNLLASTPELAELAMSFIEETVQRPTTSRITKGVLPLRHGGEMGCVAQRGGGKYVALTNDNEFFHMAEDRFDSNVDVGIVCSYARAFRDLVSVLSNR
jgi:hypothetical protein|tara:strand:- start:941 stop:2080 length:1140 start_codon:yes stop_codon:yes gene_type:complete